MKEPKKDWDQKCHPVGACKGCMWWTMSCVLLEYGKPVVEGAAECKHRETPATGKVKAKSKP